MMYFFVSQEMHGNYRKWVLHCSSITMVMIVLFCSHSDKEAIENLKSLMTLPQKAVNELGVATW